MDRMEELAKLLVMQEMMQNQMQFTDQMISKLRAINSERSRFAQEEELQLRNPKKSAIGKPGNMKKPRGQKKKAEDLYRVDSDESEDETAQDERQQKKGVRRAVKRNKKQESVDTQVLQDEISKLLCVEPLSKEERAELEYLRQKHRNRILKSTSVEGWEQQWVVSEVVDRRYTRALAGFMREVVSKASQRPGMTLRQEQKQKLQVQRKDDVLLSETVRGCSEDRERQKKQRESVQTQSYGGEEQIQRMIQQAIEKEKVERKERERKKKEKDLKKERKRERQRALEREREAERQMLMEQEFEEMKTKMETEIEKIKQELEIERDSKKKIKRQAKKRQECLKERVKILEKQIEEMKDMKGNAHSTSEADVEDAKAGVSRENDGNAQEAKTERKTEAERQKEVVEGQRKTNQKKQGLEKTEMKEQEARENKRSHSSNPPSKGGMEETKVGVDNEEGSVQKIKRHVMDFFAWIWKGLRRVGSALALAYDFFDSI